MKQTAEIYFFSLALFVIAFNGFAEGMKTSSNQNEIKFSENKNQWNSSVLYRAQLDGGLVFLEKNAFTYNFYDKETLRNNHLGKNKTTTPEIRTHAYKMGFVNSSASVIVSAKTPTSDYCNYFIGKDKSKWAGNVKNYREVNYKNLYNGIDLQVLGKQNSVKYNFIVSPAGNADQIQLKYEGLKNLFLKDGTLVIKTSINEMIEEKPYAYQIVNNQKVEVSCEFVLKENTIYFKFPEEYDKSKELVIDPVLVFAASSGSLADNFGMTATYDNEGNLYSGGTVFGVGYPTTLGAYDTTWNSNTAYLYGRTDVVITKYDKTGASLLYSTYIGGYGGTEIVTSLVVDQQNNLLLYGATGSNDFPVTSTAYDITFNGGQPMYFYRNGTFFYGGTDIYLAKFNNTGTSLLASTYIGGSLNDGVNYNNDSIFLFDFYDSELNTNIPIYESQYDSLQFNYGDQYRGEINVDSVGNAYIASSTRSGNFPIVNGSDNTLGGKQDAVIFKFNSDFSQLLWSTYLGGEDNDAGYALALDDSLNVYVTGGTRSSNFSTTAGALNTLYNGGKADGYITKIKKDGTAILYSTFLGTATYDQCYFVQLDVDGNIYVVGQTNGVMPITAGVYNNPNSGQFISKLNASLSTIIFSTVFGNGNGQPNISPSAFLVDDCKNIYVSGWGGNILTGPPTQNMPVTLNAIQSSSGDGYNFYLFVLSSNAQSLVYASYFGGNLSQEHVDGGTSRFDKKGIVYQSVCAGCGGNDDFPVTPGAWPNTGADVNHNTQNFNCNNGVFKFDFQVPLADAMFSADTTESCAPYKAVFHNESSGGANFLWDFGNNTTSTEYNPVITYNYPGTYIVHLYVKDPARCNVWDTVAKRITVSGWCAACQSDDVFVPNTFTPNDDGENDILYVRSNDVEELYFAVYNRWGQMVFETTDITKGWDGIYKGMKADPAVFAWYLRAKCYNGDELKKKGNTTLIR
jgi:gliding motility-associated-like protein